MKIFILSYKYTKRELLYVPTLICRISKKRAENETWVVKILKNNIPRKRIASARNCRMIWSVSWRLPIRRREPVTRMTGAGKKRDAEEVNEEVNEQVEEKVGEEVKEHVEEQVQEQVQERHR